MAQQVYGQMFAFFDQALLEEEIDIDWEFNPDAKPVATQAKGYAGVTKGSGLFTCTVTNALPRTGPEINFIEYADKQTFIDFVVTIGSVQLVSRGTVTNVKGKGGASGEGRIDFIFTGSKPTVK